MIRRRVCGVRCMTAGGDVCDCVCGGVNHGLARLWAVEVSGGYKDDKDHKSEGLEAWMEVFFSDLEGVSGL